jgi:hypothetical protein
MMRIRTRYGLVICGLALTACAANGPKGPAATVTPPAVGRPPAPQSAQAALSSEAFTPYAGLGAAANDGLALGDTYGALHTACMNAAGYSQYADSTPYPVRANSGLTFAPPFGGWGYIGAAEAAQNGFNVSTPSPGIPASGPNVDPNANPFAGMPTGVYAAAAKCGNIVMDFTNAQFAHSMAIIETLNNDIGADVYFDGAIKKATRNWSACMAKNGYTTPDAQTLATQEQDALGVSSGMGAAASGLHPAQNQAQIATAVSDANCTQATDLAGIYFAVQANYEKQFVSANQQALNAAVRQYKANYAKELRELPALLRTASAIPGSSRPHPGAHHKP